MCCTQCTGNVEVSLLKKVLLAKFPDILGIHEMHVWTYTPSYTDILGIH